MGDRKEETEKKISRIESRGDFTSKWDRQYATHREHSVGIQNWPKPSLKFSSRQMRINRKCFALREKKP